MLAYLDDLRLDDRGNAEQRCHRHEQRASPREEARHLGFKLRERLLLGRGELLGRHQRVAVIKGAVEEADHQRRLG